LARPLTLNFIALFHIADTLFLLSLVVVVVEKNATAQKSDAQSLLAIQVLQLQLITG
jgi:hypothetical protein